MKEKKLIGRVVVEIRCQENIELDNAQLCNIVQFIGHKINLGHKGESFMDELPHMPEFEVLYEHECPSNGGFKILTDESLIHDFYYSNEGAKFVKKED